MSEADGRAFRAFVRRHHPDRGGDPEVFRAGLVAFGRGPQPGDHPPAASPVAVHHRRAGLGVLLDHWSARRRARHRPPRVR